MRQKSTVLYNCKSDGDQYRITKFDADLNVESSYLTSLTECECPAGARTSCRHRQMLPKFLARKAANGSQFFNYDREEWIKGEAEVEFVAKPEPASLPPLPQGVTMLSLCEDNIEEVHNAIAEAVGEPKLKPKPQSTIPLITRRL